jgi:hypothetical protein
MVPPMVARVDPSLPKEGFSDSFNKVRMPSPISHRVV